MAETENHAPVATDDKISLYQRSYISDNVTGRGVDDSDPDGDDIIVTNIAYGSYSKFVTTGSTVINGKYGELAIYDDGFFSFNTENGAAIAVGDSATDVFIYTISDDYGGTDTAKLSIEVVGTDLGDYRSNTFLLTGSGHQASGDYGDDLYIIDDASDKIIEKFDEGVDTIRSSISIKALAANVENLTLTGSAVLSGTGNSLANTIIGNSGANVLDGGAGSDLLRGGAGKDTFLFAKAGSAGNLDHIGDFRADDDTIKLEDSAFKALKIGALHADEFALITSRTQIVDTDAHILYDKAQGALYYDANGGNASGRVQFAVIDNHTTLTFHDFIIA